MKSVKLTFLMLIIFGWANAQINLEKKFSFESENALLLNEINSGVFKYTLLLEDSSKIMLYNLDYSLWKEITIPEVEDFVVEDVEFLSQNLFDPDDKIEFIVDYYRNTPYLMIHKIMNEDGTVLLADTNTHHEIIMADANNFKLTARTWYAPYSFSVYSLPGIYPPLMSSAQTLSLNNNTLSISGGNEVNLGVYIQQLSFSNDTIYLSNGGSVYIGEAFSNAVSDVTIDEAFGVGEAYPNPANSVLNVHYILPVGEESGEIALFNENGAKVIATQVYNSTENAQLNLSGLPSGIYNVRLQTKNGYTGYKKVVLMN